MNPIEVWRRLEGSVLDGRFRLLEISDAGTEALFRALRVDHLEEPEVSVRIFPAEGDADVIVERYLEASFFDHLHLLRCYGAGTYTDERGTFVYIASEPAQLQLTGVLQAGPMPLAEVARLGLSLVEALRYLHQRGLVYCALEPAAVVKAGGVWKLSDFSQMRISGPGYARETKRLLAARHGVPPEAYQGEVSAEWDTWSLASLLQLAAVGPKPPRESVGLPRGVPRRSLPDALASIVAECQAALPANRCSLDRLEQLLQKLPDAAPLEPIGAQPENVPATEPVDPLAFDHPLLSPPPQPPPPPPNGYNATEPAPYEQRVVTFDPPAPPGRMPSPDETVYIVPPVGAQAIVPMPPAPPRRDSDTEKEQAEHAAIYFHREEARREELELSERSETRRHWIIAGVAAAILAIVLIATNAIPPPKAGEAAAIAARSNAPSAGKGDEASRNRLPESAGVAVETPQDVFQKFVAASQSRNLEQQTGLYAPKLDNFYQARDVSRDWVKQNRERTLKTHGPLRSYKTSNVKVRAINPDTVAIEFDKEWSFESPNALSGKTRSQLGLRRVENEWKIVSERDLKVYWVRRGSRAQA